MPFRAKLSTETQNRLSALSDDLAAVLRDVQTDMMVNGYDHLPPQERPIARREDHLSSVAPLFAAVDTLRAIIRR